MGHATFRKTLISQSTQDNSRCPGTSSNVTLRRKSQLKGALTPQLHHPGKAKGSKYASTVQCFQRKSMFPLELERVHDTLYKTPEVSRDTHPHSRGMLSFPPQVKKGPVSPPQVEMKVDCPAWPGKECQRPPRTSKGCCYLFDTGGEPGGLVIIQKLRIFTSTRDQARLPCTN